MKKKLILIMAIIMVIAIGVTVLAGCKKDEDDEKTKDEPVITTVEQFITKLDTATSFTLVFGDEEIRFDGTTIYRKDIVDGKPEVTYDVIDGDNMIVYSSENGVWSKRIVPIPSVEKGNFGIKMFFILTVNLSLDTSLYDKADGVWTLRADNRNTLKIENGKLVIKTSERTMTASLEKIKITLPNEVKNAEPAITTVEEFLAKLDTATAYVIREGEDERKYDGKTMYVKSVAEGEIEEAYVVIDGDNFVEYRRTDGIWYKETAPIGDQINNLGVKVNFEMASDVPLEAEVYDKADGVWTLKSDNSVTLRMENGKLVIKTSDGTMTASLAKITVTLPDEVKNAVEANPPVDEITTVEEFLAKLDTATSVEVRIYNAVTRFDGTTLFTGYDNDLGSREYVVYDGNSYIAYYCTYDIWYKEILDDGAVGVGWNVKAIFEDYIDLYLDPDLYNIANGVWTYKDNPALVISIVEGDLVATIDGAVAVAASLATFTITLPDEVTNAVDSLVSVEDFARRMDTAEGFVVTDGESEMICDGTTVYKISVVDNVVVEEGYYVIDGNKSIWYSRQDDAWVKRTAEIPEGEELLRSAKAMFEMFTGISLDATLYDIDNYGTWTLKTGNTTTLQGRGSRIHIRINEVRLSASLAKITITLPDEVKNAAEATPPVEEITTVEEFPAKLDTAQSFTMTSGEDIVRFDGKTMYMKQTSEGITQEVYSVIEDDKVIGYIKVDDKWVKMESPIPAEDKANYSVKKMFEHYTSPLGVMFDATLYDIDNNGVWTLKSDNSFILRMENGKLVIKTSDGTMTASLAKITVTLPDEVKNAAEATPPVDEITTVEQFIAKLDTVEGFIAKINGAEVKYDGAIMYQRTEYFAGIVSENYYVRDGSNYIEYYQEEGIWYKEVDGIFEAFLGDYTCKTVLSAELNSGFDTELFDISVEDVWTSKADNTMTLRIENGKLSVTQSNGKYIIELAKFTIELPEGINDAVEKPVNLA